MILKSLFALLLGIILSFLCYIPMGIFEGVLEKMEVVSGYILNAEILGSFFAVYLGLKGVDRLFSNYNKSIVFWGFTIILISCGLTFIVLLILRIQKFGLYPDWEPIDYIVTPLSCASGVVAAYIVLREKKLS